MRDIRVVLAMVVASGLAACGGREGPPAPVTQHGSSRPALSRAEAASGAVVVQPGETLYAISRRTGVPLRALIDANNLQAPFRLQAGRRLVLPGREAPAAVAAAGPSPAPAPAPAVPRGSVDSAPIAPPPAGTPGPTAGVTPSPGAPPPVPPPAPGGVVAAPVSPGETGEAAARAPAPPTAGTPSPSAAAPEPEAAPAARPAQPPAPAVETPAPARAARTFLWPVRGQIVSSYGSKTGGLQNDGINIAGPRGAPVRAAENGVVVYAGNELKGFGNLLLLRHADGWMSAYAHLDEIQVDRGQTVQRGQAIGRLGQTGSVSSPQLHFELRRAGKAVDPREYLGPPQTARAE